MTNQSRIAVFVVVAEMMIALSGLPAVHAATPPDLINYQGVLRDSNNKPLTGSYDMVFRFYDAEAGGNEVLVDRHLVAGTGAVTVSGGLFNAQLGSGEVIDGQGPGVVTTLGQAFRQFAAVYLEVQVAGEVLNPRTRVVSGAYALNNAADQALLYSRTGNSTDDTFSVPGGTFTNSDLIHVIIMAEGGSNPWLSLTTAVAGQNLGEPFAGNLGYVEAWITSGGTSRELAFSRVLGEIGTSPPWTARMASSKDNGPVPLGNDWMLGAFQISWSRSGVAAPYKWWVYRVRG